jgi:hypothetical protein
MVMFVAILRFHDGMMAVGNKISKWFFMDAFDQFVALGVL